MKSNVFVIIFALTAIFGIWKTISLSNELKATKAELAIAQQEIKAFPKERCAIRVGCIYSCLDES